MLEQVAWIPYFPSNGKENKEERWMLFFSCLVLLCLIGRYWCAFSGMTTHLLPLQIGGPETDRPVDSRDHQL